VSSTIRTRRTFAAALVALALVAVCAACGGTSSPTGATVDVVKKWRVDNEQLCFLLKVKNTKGKATRVSFWIQAGAQNTPTVENYKVDADGTYKVCIAAPQTTNGLKDSTDLNQGKLILSDPDKKAPDANTKPADLPKSDYTQEDVASGTWGSNPDKEPDEAKKSDVKPLQTE
jgi:hypothetical protein